MPVAPVGYRYPSGDVVGPGGSIIVSPSPQSSTPSSGGGSGGSSSTLPNLSPEQVKFIRMYGTPEQQERYGGALPTPSGSQTTNVVLDPNLKFSEEKVLSDFQRAGTREVTVTSSPFEFSISGTSGGQPSMQKAAQESRKLEEPKKFSLEPIQRTSPPIKGSSSMIKAYTYADRFPSKPYDVREDMSTLAKKKVTRAKIIPKLQESGRAILGVGEYEGTSLPQNFVSAGSALGDIFSAWGGDVKESGSFAVKPASFGTGVFSQKTGQFEAPAMTTGFKISEKETAAFSLDRPAELIIQEAGEKATIKIYTQLNEEVQKKANDYQTQVNEGKIDVPTAQAKLDSDVKALSVEYQKKADEAFTREIGTSAKLKFMVEKKGGIQQSVKRPLEPRNIGTAVGIGGVVVASTVSPGFLGLTSLAAGEEAYLKGKPVKGTVATAFGIYGLNVAVKNIGSEITMARLEAVTQQKPQVSYGTRSMIGETGDEVFKDVYKIRARTGSASLKGESIVYSKPLSDDVFKYSAMTDTTAAAYDWTTLKPVTVYSRTRSTGTVPMSKLSPDGTSQFIMNQKSYSPISSIKLGKEIGEKGGFFEARYNTAPTVKDLSKRYYAGKSKSVVIKDKEYLVGQSGEITSVSGDEDYATVFSDIENIGILRTGNAAKMTIDKTGGVGDVTGGLRGGQKYAQQTFYFPQPKPTPQRQIMVSPLQTSDNGLLSQASRFYKTKTGVPVTMLKQQQGIVQGQMTRRQALSQPLSTLQSPVQKRTTLLYQENVLVNKRVPVIAQGTGQASATITSQVTATALGFPTAAPPTMATPPTGVPQAVPFGFAIPYFDREVKPSNGGYRRPSRPMRFSKPKAPTGTLVGVTTGRTQPASQFKRKFTGYEVRGIPIFGSRKKKTLRTRKISMSKLKGGRSVFSI